MAETARPAASLSSAPNSAGAVKNEKNTTLPSQTPSASRCNDLRTCVTPRVAGEASLAEHELVRRSLHHRPGGRAPEDVPVDLLRQREVPLGDPAGGVRLQLDPELPPGD